VNKGQRFQGLRNISQRFQVLAVRVVHLPPVFGLTREMFTRWIQVSLPVTASVKKLVACFRMIVRVVAKERSFRGRGVEILLRLNLIAQEVLKWLFR
jgi:hypothetical protein